MKGSYVLIIKTDEAKNITVGKKEDIYFKKGFYGYVGSALNSLEKRIARHIKPSDEKKLHWHIDYFLEKSEIKDIFIKKNQNKEECEIAKSLLENLSYIEGFGCSDCNCKSHLFFSKDRKKILKNLKKMGMEIYKV